VNRLRISFLSIVVSPLLAACTVNGPDPSATATSSEALGTASAACSDDEGDHGATPVIYDSDIDFDDSSALAYLCQEHKQGRIDLRAVTVENDGVGLPGEAIRHARCILQRCGLTNIPVADGSLVGVNTPGPAIRGAIEGVLEGALADCTASAAPSAIDAPHLIAKTVRDAHGSAVIITSGPLSNVAAAFRLGRHGGDDDEGRGDVAAGVRKLYSMAGALNVSGNVNELIAPGWDDTQELNIWADPPAARDVFAGVRPGRVFLTPLDATQYVPITEAYAARLQNDQTTAEAQTVNAIIHQPITTFGISLGLFFWWDPLNAVAATRNDDVTSFHPVRISVVQSGTSSGRTVVDNGGTLVQAATSASQQNFENTFIDALNGIPAHDVE